MAYNIWIYWIFAMLVKSMDDDCNNQDDNLRYLFILRSKATRSFVCNSNKKVGILGRNLHFKFIILIHMNKVKI